MKLTLADRSDRSHAVSGNERSSRNSDRIMISSPAANRLAGAIVFDGKIRVHFAVREGTSRDRCRTTSPAGTYRAIEWAWYGAEAGEIVGIVLR
jgi:hypothetical protein